ncbi:MAG: Bax inhibitor-1 family protein [Actinomycetota bacterium]|nr:Bax inhibitor-1 family protein [Actinomycetota bacterium]
MSYSPSTYVPVAALQESDRIAFMVKVYRHLGLAIGAFMAFEYLLFTAGVAESLWDMLAGSGGAWLLFLGLFMLGSWIGTQASYDLTNVGRQYSGLFGIAAVEAIIFAPFLYYAFNVKQAAGDVWVAAVITALGFAGLSFTAWTTRRDLSFLRPILMWVGVAAMVLIVAALLFGMNIGTWFSVAMVALMGASILYNTQKILHSYPEQAYVGASVTLFASLMTMFWYILQIVMDR